MHWSFLNKSPTVNNKQMNHSWLPASDTDSIFFFLVIEQVLHDLCMTGPCVQIKNKKAKYYFLMNLRIDSWRAPNQSTVSNTYCER